MLPAPEIVNEIKQWLSLRHSPTEIAKVYGVSRTQVRYLQTKFKLRTHDGPGRYKLSPEAKEKIIDDLKDLAKRHVDIAVANAVHPLTVTYIAKQNGLMRHKGHRRGSKYRNVEFGSALAEILGER